ncbi:MAG: transposase, partial [Actinomycetia bacterium]|nr:transposase [Actinomycetes bacterium]
WTEFLRSPDQLAGSRALVRDRGSQFIDAFDETFRTEGFQILRTPVRTPAANTFAERWIATVRRELLKQPEGLPRTIIWNRRHLERLAIDYIDHYSIHRPHRSLEQRPCEAVLDQPPSVPASVTMLRTTRCEGLINDYEDAAQPGTTEFSSPTVVRRRHTRYDTCMTMLSFRVDDHDADEAQRWAEALGIDRSELLREALRRHLDQLASEGDGERWAASPLDAGERALVEIADWGTAEDWSDWVLDATG